MKKTLLVGYGNTLRGDDGAGVEAARMLKERFPWVDVLILHQLGPELAETIARYDAIVYLDASIETEELVHEEIGADESKVASRSHEQSPQEVLAICRAVYGHAPKTYIVVHIPAFDFRYGEQFSPGTEESIRACVERVAGILEGLREEA